MAAAMIATALPAFASDPVAVNGLNQLEYTKNVDPDRSAVTPEEIFENWLDVDIRFRNVLVGFRYEAFLPPFENKPDSLRQGMTQRYTEAAFSSGGFRLGNFYEIFGRGLLFRSYEERSLGVDTNMDGVLLWGTRGPLEAKAFTGRMRQPKISEGTDVLRGVDLGVNAGHGFSAGGSYLLQAIADPAFSGVTSIASPRHVEIAGGRASHTHHLFDLYYEGGRLNRLFLEDYEVDDGVRFDDVRGEGHYAAVNVFPLSGLAVTAEYKEYDRFRFRPYGASDDSGDPDYNNPPAVTRETGYTLISRSPHQLDTDDEKGFQVEAVATPRDGTTITVSRAETDHLDGEKLYREWYVEWRQAIGYRCELALVYDYIDNQKSPWSKNHTPVVEFEYFSGGEWSLRGEYQYQESTKNDGLDRTHYALLEYHPNMDLTFSLVGEHSDKCAPSIEGDGSICNREKKDDFLYGQIDYFIDQDHHVTLTVGKRQGGFVCVGGVCREVPELQGVEFKLVSTF